MSSPTNSTLPDWAVLQASAALKIGQSMPEIERGLVAKGLAKETASAVVLAVLESRVRANPPPGPSDRAMNVHRIASVLAVVICLGLAFVYGGGYSAGKTFLWLILPVGCIWLAESIVNSAPPSLVRWIAWVVVGLIVMYRVVLLLMVKQ